MDKNDLNILLEQCKKNKPAAFKEIYDRFSKAMFNTSMRIVNNRDEAEDILQESFVKAFKDMTRFVSADAFGSWLKKVVVNHSLNSVQRKKLSFIALNEETEAVDEAGEKDEMNYDIKIVVQCISELPDGYRVILTLFLFEQYSHKQIGETLNISEGTSKSQYNRARKKLVELVKQKITVHA